MGHHIVHLPGDPGSLLHPGPLGPLARLLGEERQLMLQPVSAFPQALHQFEPGPHVQAEQHRGDRNAGRRSHHDHHRCGHRQVPQLIWVVHHPEDGGGDRAQRCQAGQEQSDPPGRVRRGQGVEADDAQQEAHLGRHDSQAHQDHQDRPAPSQRQNGADHEADHDEDPRREHGSRGEDRAFRSALRCRRHAKGNVERHCARPRPPQRSRHTPEASLPVGRGSGSPQITHGRQPMRPRQPTSPAAPYRLQPAHRHLDIS